MKVKRAVRLPPGWGVVGDYSEIYSELAKSNKARPWVIVEFEDGARTRLAREAVLRYASHKSRKWKVRTTVFENQLAVRRYKDEEGVT
jgi:hypothetical protein